MHIRKTDLDLDLARTPKKLVTYDLFYRWVEKQRHEEPVYLMTDNRQTQLHFQNTYNTAKYPMQKILVYSNITDDPVSSSNSSSAVVEQLFQGSERQRKKIKKKQQPQKPLAVDHRFTSLEHAAIDILIAAHAWDFRTSPFSSVSDLVKMMNFLHRCTLTS